MNAASLTSTVGTLLLAVRHGGIGRDSQKGQSGPHMSPTHRREDNLWFLVLMRCFWSADAAAADRCSLMFMMALWRLSVQLSLCAVLLWDPGHQRGTGNTHNYHVNEGAAVCRGQLTQRCATEQTDPPEVSLGCPEHAGLRGGGGGVQPMGSN